MRLIIILSLFFIPTAIALPISRANETSSSSDSDTEINESEAESELRFAESNQIEVECAEYLFNGPKTRTQAARIVRTALEFLEETSSHNRRATEHDEYARNLLEIMVDTPITGSTTRIISPKKRKIMIQIINQRSK